MNDRIIYEKTQEKKLFPHVGQRITKTTIAVFICLIIYYLRGYRGAEMPTEACITAIICMQPYVRDTRDYAISRFAGTLIGAVWGLLFLLLLLIFPSMGSSLPLLYARMAIGVLLSLYTSVLLRKPDTASLAAIVFLCVVIAFPDIESPLVQAAIRILDVFIGTTVAIGVNVFRLPREKQPDKVFFIRTKDLVPDRFSQISPAAMYRLNYLYDDGAKICLMSEHAPAFFILQMSATKLNVPLIVMDGAAIYDYSENRFLQAEYIEPELIIGIMERLQALNLSCFIYTIHNNRTCIFHQGEIRKPEKTVLERMKRSPYRDYLDGDIHSPEEIVYFKIIDEDGKLAEIESRLSRVLPKGKLRAVIRKQAGAPGISGLYIYAHTATMEQAEKRLMQMLREKDPGLTPVNVRLKSPYSSERDAMHILYTVGRSYEPVRLFRKKRKR